MDTTDDSYFMASVKGLYFNEESKLLMIQEKGGEWEVPGGRMQKDEQFIETLKRECLEETGLECEVLDERPLIVYPAIDRKERLRIMIFFKIKIKNFDFKPSDECVDLQFYSKEEIRNLVTYPQLKPLVNYL